ncbi:hypothetical protein [Muricoccus vinaceus]|uniref:Uncharacterized protein n=1 Tax=Muricoccus vinaceus TaxID=424704 RepID=A0ABV6ILM2_9PROT
MRFFDFVALTVLAVVPILWCRSRLPQIDRDPPISEQAAVRLGALFSAVLCAIYIMRYVVYR